MKFRCLFCFLLVVAALQGCSGFFQIIPINPHTVPPRSAIAEIREYGITLSSEDRPLPRDAIIRLYSGETPYVYTRLLSWYVTPHPDFDEREEFDFSIGFPEEHGFRVTYSFSIEDDNSSIVIPSDQGEISDYRVEGYFGDLIMEDFPAELISNGNILLTQRLAYIPLTATHIEAFMQTSGSSEKISLAKVALEDLAAWRKYIKPLTENQQQ